VARIDLAVGLADDFDRILSHLVQHDVTGAASRIDEIIQAIDVLKANPLLGRPTRHGHCELVIGRGARGYLALYRYVPEADIVLVLAIRSQREAGYRAP
jgi:toxin ParE1/3/4